LTCECSLTITLTMLLVVILHVTELNIMVVWLQAEVSRLTSRATELEALVSVLRGTHSTGQPVRL
jgi:hypothetical protein